MYLTDLTTDQVHGCPLSYTVMSFVTGLDATLNRVLNCIWDCAGKISRAFFPS